MYGNFEAVLFSHYLIISLVILTILFLITRTQRFESIVLFISIFSTFRYVLWRGFFTINTNSYPEIIISIILYTAELFGIAIFLAFIYRTWNRTDHKATTIADSMTDSDLPDVDIFIPTYNEETDILYKTIIGCQAQDYPKDKFRVYVLDDGKREEIKQLAERMGCSYITRDTNVHAKAGNLNNALGVTTGNLVALFDADHVPVRNFLRSTVSFFKDHLVAFVHTTQHFYNPDEFQKNLGLEKELSNIQDLWFNVIQSGMDYYNSSFFCGTSGVFRRAHLKEIGGFKHIIVEDLPTSLELHSRGYKSVYLNEVMSAGLSPERFEDFLTQWKRWGKSCIKVFFTDNPLIKKGLSFHQRVNYLFSTAYFFFGFPRLIFMITPLLFFFFGYLPLSAELKTYFAFFAPFLVSQLLISEYACKGHNKPFWSDVYETALTFSSIMAFFEALIKPVRKFSPEVTPKGIKADNSAMNSFCVMPHAIILILLVAGIVFGAYKQALGFGNRGAYIISSIWSSYNIMVLLAVIVTSFEKKELRRYPRLTRNIKTRFIIPGKEIYGYTTDISVDGVAIKSYEQLGVVGREITVELSSSYGEKCLVNGNVIRNYTDNGGNNIIVLQYTGVCEDTYQRIVRQMFSPENSWKLDEVRETTIINSLCMIISSPVKALLLKRA